MVTSMCLAALTISLAITWLSCFAPKDEAASAWRRMLLQIRTLGYSVMVVRVDNDSVLLSASFRDVCNEFNVDIQRTAPYRHHQLARIERHWRTVADAVTALLTEVGCSGQVFLGLCLSYGFICAQQGVALWCRLYSLSESHWASS